MRNILRSIQINKQNKKKRKMERTKKKKLIWKITWIRAHSYKDIQYNH